MKNRIFFLAIVLCSVELYCQVLGQDKEGFSTIIQPSATFNLDLSEKVATLNYYREGNLIGYRDSIDYVTEELCRINSDSQEGFKKCLEQSWKNQNKKYRKLGLIYGIDLKGSSSDGIALLINEERVRTSSVVSGLIGLRWQKRKYRFGKLDAISKTIYQYKDDTPKEKKLVSAIEKEVEKLIETGNISNGKKDDLLFFRGVVSNSDKIESIEKKIESIKNRRGFLDPKKQNEILNKRLSNLNLLDNYISKIQQTISAYNKAKKSGSSNSVYVLLDNLNNNVKNFEKVLKDKSIKSLSIKSEQKKHKDSTNWVKIKSSISEAVEATNFNLYKLHELVKKPVSLDTVIKTYKEYLKYLKNKKKDYENLRIAKGKSYTIKRNLFYFKGGFNGTSFKYDLANGSNSISDRFEDRDFQGYQLELGLTSQTRQYNFFGLNLSMSRTSNVAMLTSTKYKFEQTDSSVIPSITTSEEVTALSDPFDSFFKYGFNFDYVRLFPFHNNDASEEEIKKSKLMLSLNPYIRHSFYDNAETLKPNTSFGLGVYSFNKNDGSIAGGFFVQADDVFNVNRKKAINFTKQISFGIVFKVAIKSFKPEAE